MPCIYCSSNQHASSKCLQRKPSHVGKKIADAAAKPKIGPQKPKVAPPRPKVAIALDEVVQPVEGAMIAAAPARALAASPRLVIANASQGASEHDEEMSPRLSAVIICQWAKSFSGQVKCNADKLAEYAKIVAYMHQKRIDMNKLAQMAVGDVAKLAKKAGYANYIGNPVALREYIEQVQHIVNVLRRADPDLPATTLAICDFLQCFTMGCSAETLVKLTVYLVKNGKFADILASQQAAKRKDGGAPLEAGVGGAVLIDCPLDAREDTIVEAYMKLWSESEGPKESAEDFRAFLDDIRPRVAPERYKQVDFLIKDYATIYENMMG